MASLHLAATQLHATKPCELNDPSPHARRLLEPAAAGGRPLPSAHRAGLGLDIDEAALAQRRVGLPGT